MLRYMTAVVLVTCLIQGAMGPANVTAETLDAPYVGDEQDHLQFSNTLKGATEALTGIVLVFCRPSVVLNDATMFDYGVSEEDDFVTLVGKWSWYGAWSGNRYRSVIKVDLFVDGKSIRVTSVEYDDNAMLPCENCKKLGEARRQLNAWLKNN
jgi:hypothetical protein